MILVPTDDDRALLRELEDRFALDPMGNDDGTYSIIDAECVDVAKMGDPRVADLVVRLLNAFWKEHREQ